MLGSGDETRHRQFFKRNKKQKIGIIPFGHWVGVGNHHENGDELRRRETRAGLAVRE